MLSAALGIPHVYDMHSSLPQQLSNFAYSRSRVLRWIFDRFERAAVRHSKVVIVICPELRRIVQELQPGAEPVLIENAPGAGDGPSPGGRRRGARRRSASRRRRRSSSTPARSRRTRGSICCLPRPRSSRRPVPTRGSCSRAGVPSRWRGAGAGGSGRARRRGRSSRASGRPHEIPAILEAADVLVSPRSRGTNTPLKIYQYLRSGRAIVATRLLTHTQVLDDSVAILTGVVAAGVRRRHPRGAGRPAMAAARSARAPRSSRPRKYSYDAYLERTREVVARVTSAARPQVAGGVA